VAGPAAAVVAVRAAALAAAVAAAPTVRVDSDGLVGRGETEVTASAALEVLVGQVGLVEAAVAGVALSKSSPMAG
jgi:hypothetical protein